MSTRPRTHESNDGPDRHDRHDRPDTHGTHRAGGIGRRQVLGATAWAVPVLVVATPAPAFASSPVGVITVAGFTARTNQFPGQIAWSQFSIRYDANGGPSTSSISFAISTNPATQEWLSGSTTLLSGQPLSVGSGATAALPSGTYRLVLTVTSDAAPTVVVQSDPVNVN
jgi:hypothetical protein